MIELQKYSKIDDEMLLKHRRATLKHTDSRLKVVGYVSLAIVVSLVAITYQVGRFFVATEERNLRLFDEDTNSESMKAFLTFVAETSRSYVDKKETANRYRIFKNNYDTVAKRQWHERHLSYQSTINNQFADLTGEEFVQKVARRGIVPEAVMSSANPFSSRKEKVPIIERPVGDLPQYKNWFEEGIMAVADNQQQCASAWAFSTVGTMQALQAIKGGSQDRVDLSAQQLVDCDAANNGCDGGWPYKSYAYTSKYGLMPKSEYAYTGTQGTCMYSEGKAAFQNTGMVQERYMSNQRLKELVNQQPVSAGIVVTEGFMQYKSGILTDQSLACSSASQEINHVVTIVGFGKSEKSTVASTWCKEFWIAQNSWGAQWGEQGFFKLCMDDAGKDRVPYGTCHINRFPAYPTLN